MKVQSCYIDGMTGLSFIHAHRHDCATTSDVQKLVVLGWSLDNPSAKALPWLWIAPSHIGQRGLFSFRSSKNMAPFLRTLAGWFDIQDDQGTQCMGQILFQPSAAQRPHFDWLIPKELAVQRARALGDLREQPTIALWWAAMVQHTPLWACTAMGWLEPSALQQNTTSFMQESMHEMMGTWIKKTQTYYGIVEQSCLSWSMPDPDESWMRMLFLCTTVLDNSSLTMDTAGRVHLNIPWRLHAPVLVAILNFHGGLLCEEYGIAEIPHDFLTHTLANRNAHQSIALPPLD